MVVGAAWDEEIAAPERPSRVRVDSVHFAPGARTVWHRHPRHEAERGAIVTDTEYLADPPTV
ncbi:MAG: hypothetical protein ACRDP3_18860 [Streptomyces sp.]|uniref:hypothetical protein n=1 Tax=Streptomyces sp. TaxID=1931 RepID=UPI003D6BEE82